MCLDEIIKEAKCCSGKLGHKVARGLSFGNEDEELSFDLIRLNAYICTLEENEETYYTKKELVYNKKVDFNSLQKKNNNLYLNAKSEPRVVCTKIKMAPCLTDSEIQKIIEEIRLLCKSCGCNC